MDNDFVELISDNTDRQMLKFKFTASIADIKSRYNISRVKNDYMQPSTLSILKICLNNRVFHEGGKFYTRGHIYNFTCWYTKNFYACVSFSIVCPQIHTHKLHSTNTPWL